MWSDLWFYYCTFYCFRKGRLSWREVRKERSKWWLVLKYHLTTPNRSWDNSNRCQCLQGFHHITPLASRHCIITIILHILNRNWVLTEMNWLTWVLTFYMTGLTELLAEVITKASITKHTSFKYVKHFECGNIQSKASLMSLILKYMPQGAQSLNLGILLSCMLGDTTSMSNIFKGSNSFINLKLIPLIWLCWVKYIRLTMDEYFAWTRWSPSTLRVKQLMLSDEKSECMIWCDTVNLTPISLITKRSFANHIIPVFNN